MAIRCGSCGGTHTSVAEVRACSARRGAATSSEPAPVTEPIPFPQAGDPPSAGRRHAAEWAGPEALGRWLLIRPGGEIAAPWVGADRVAVTSVDLERPDELVATLRAAAASRRRLVVEVGCELPAEGVVERRSLVELGARHLPLRDHLVHLVTAGSVDDRGPAGASFALADHAVGLGAVVAGDADVRLPDGRSVWLDGGPIRPWDRVDGHGVVHRVSLEHGSLEPLGNVALSASLAPDQLAAVAHPGGVARIVAPAGSGKTRVLTERARHLVRGWRVPASAVMCVAFNVRAANEMRERTADVPGLQIRTLNSLALAVVNGAPPFRAQRRRDVIDERAVRSRLDRLIGTRVGRRRAGTDPAAVWIEALSLARLGLLPAHEVESELGGDVDGFAEVLLDFRRGLREAGELDFDEQIVAACELLLVDPAARAQAQRACRLMLVDELQDLVPAHLLLVRLLAGPDLAVFGVGDDDQTIYGYSGATPRWLLDFADLFPGAADHPLEVNYRCPPAVVEAASTLLTHNRVRVAKVVRAAPGRQPSPDGLDLEVRLTEQPVRSTVEVATAAANADGVTSVAVLARVNAALAPVHVALTSAGIPVTSPVGPSWLDRTGVRAALAWLRLSATTRRFASSDLADAVRHPPRGMRDQLREMVAKKHDVSGLVSLADWLNTPRDAEKVRSFASDVELLRDLAASGASTERVLRAVRDEVGLGAEAGTLDASRRRLDRSPHGDDLDALIALGALHPDIDGFAEWVAAGLARRAGDGEDGITLSTIHSVKGLEWPHVVVHDVGADTLPHRLASDLEEERRLLHVAITRASSRATVVAPARSPSRFLPELTTPWDPSTAPPPKPAAAPPASPPARRAAPVEPAPEHRAAFAALKDWRSARAKADSVPAFIVASDKVLDAIASLMPSSLGELGTVSGVGPAKLATYGDQILAVLDEVRS